MTIWKGIGKTGELIDLGAKADIVEKSGAGMHMRKKMVRERKRKTYLEESKQPESEMAIREKAGLISKRLKETNDQEKGSKKQKKKSYKELTFLVI